MIENMDDWSDDEDPFHDDEDKPFLYDMMSTVFLSISLIVAPSNKFRQFYEYLITFIGISDILFTSYALLVSKVSLMLLYITLPFFLVEIYLNLFSRFTIDGVLINDVKLIWRKYIKR